MADDLRRVGLVFKEDGAVDFRKSLQEVNLELNKNYNQFKLNQAQWDESTTKTQKLKEQQEYLTEAYEIQRDKVETLRMQLTELENSENKNTSAIKKKRNELVNAELKLKSYSDKLEKTSKDLKNVENGVETTAEKIKRLSNELKENESRFKLTQSQYTAMTTKAQKLQDEEKYLTQAYVLQEEKISLLNSELDELESVEDKNTNAIYRKRQEIIKAKTELNNYNTRLQVVTNQLNSLSAKAIEAGEKIENMGKKIEGAGKKMSAFSAATASALVVSAKNAIEFEDAFTGVEKTVDGTEQQMAELKQGIRDMAKEIPSSTTEISAVAEAAGQLGIKTEDILSFTRVMIDLGNSTNLSAEEAASALAKFANITNMSAKDYDKLGSVIVDLGNNFATTEADIVSMATRLAATGELAGLSQSQILSLATAMSSVGVEAEAGGSAMSKLLKKIQVAVETGSKDLKDYAKVAGMTTSQFKKAFEKDAVSALTAFIGGLNDTKRNGKSAIAILEGMGLTEVRLSNTILSLASASDVMTNAVKVGAQAWENNTALTNEANKRYGTLKSQIQIAINKLKDLAITFGNKLMPAISKGIKKIEDLTKWVDKLDDKQVEWILSIAKTVVAIGPLLTILGKVTSTAGTTIKAIGTFTQALGVVKGTVTTTSTAVNGLATVIGAINPVVAIAVAAIAGLSAATYYFYKKNKEATQASKDFAQSMKDEKQAVEDRNKSIDEAAEANIAQINYVAKLKDELRNLIDENGKVKKGYEARVDFILNQLNQALGTEYTRNGEIIKSYQNLQNEIDDLIKKKKAEIQLNAEEEKYKLAIETESKAIEDLKKAHDNLGMSYDEAKKKVKEYKDAMDEWDFDKLKELGMTSQDFKNLEAYISAYEEAENKIKASLENQKQYEQDYALFTEGKYEKIGNIIKNTTQNWSDTSSETLRKSIEEQTENLNAYKEIYERTGDEIALKNQQQAEENLKQLADELYARTSTVEDMGEDEKKAWEKLATDAYNVYDEKIKNIPTDTKQKIEDTTKVISSDTQLVGATEKISQNVQSTFENNTNGESAGKNFVSGVKVGLANKSEVDGAVNASGSLGSRILNKFKDVLGIHSPSREAEEAMEYYVEGIVLGITANQKDALKTIGSLAEGINDEFNSGLDTNKSLKVNASYSSANNLTEALYNSNQKIIDLLTKILAKNPKIVMDSGALVGEIIDPIDQEMGNRQSRKERGS